MREIKDIKLVATGLGWVGKGIHLFSSVITEMIENAKIKLVVTIYMINNWDIAKELINALEEGIKTDIYIYGPMNLKDFSKVIFDKFIDLEKIHKHLNLHIIEDKMLHAKILIADDSKTLVGSANLTLSGMEKNYELGIFVEDIKISQQILTILEELDK